MSLKSKFSISMCLLLAVSIYIFVRAPSVYSWSEGTHQFITQNAINIMPSSLDWFFENYSSTIVNYCTLPDTWKATDPNEGNRHWFDLNLHGGGGTLPWAVEDNFNTFVQYLRENDWNHAAQLAGVIAHYIEDASMPLHATSDYDPGGNHVNYEVKVDSEISMDNVTDNVSGFVPQELGDIFKSTMRLLEDSYSYSYVLRPYLEQSTLWNDEIKNITENRLRTGTQLLADVWYTGMVQAGLVIGAVAPLPPPSPIHIVGNDNFTSANGVTSGSGTASDPYIIENWDISAESTNGIWIEDTTAHFVIKNCYVCDGWDAGFNGIFLKNVMNGVVDNNTCENNYAGIYLSSSNNNLISGNTFINDGLLVRDSYQNTVENNTVNGRPLVYLEGESDQVIGDAGQVILVRCENIAVKNLNLSNVGIGVELVETDNSKVMNNIVGNNSAGIGLYSSDNNLVSGNTVENNFIGIGFNGSSNNTVSGNTVEKSYGGIGLRSGSNSNVIFGNTMENNRYDIYLYSSNKNTISSNTVENNYEGDIYLYSYGVYLSGSSNNIIYHNNFTKHTSQYTRQAYDDGSNYWDNGYPSGGNYWSDYTGVDNYQGENQNILGNDNIGDTPYSISGANNQDHYPSMKLFVLEITLPEEAPMSWPLIVGVIGAIAIISIAAVVYIRRH